MKMNLLNLENLNSRIGDFSEIINLQKPLLLYIALRLYACV